jgi:hypothetical protein
MKDNRFIKIKMVDTVREIEKRNLERFKSKGWEVFEDLKIGKQGQIDNGPKKPNVKKEKPQQEPKLEAEKNNEIGV